MFVERGRHDGHGEPELATQQVHPDARNTDDESQAEPIARVMPRSRAVNAKTAKVRPGGAPEQPAHEHDGHEVEENSEHLVDEVEDRPLIARGVEGRRLVSESHLARQPIDNRHE